MGMLGMMVAIASPGIGQTVGQTVGQDGRIVYPGSFFTQFRPANASEMVARVPGFTLQVVDEDVRGFAQAAGNLVINGQRPSIKSESIENILARIPANRVARIEVGAGDLFSAEYAGKAQVLNLVLNGQGGLAGTAEATVRRAFTGKLYPEGSISALLRRGPSTFNVSLMLDNDYTTEEGYDRVTSLPGGEQQEYRRKINYIQQPNGAASASWEYVGGTNRTAHANVRLGFDRLSLTQHNDVFPAIGQVRDDRLTQRYRRRDLELGGDVTRPLAGGAFKLVGLATRRHRNNDDVSLLRVQGDLIDGSTQTLVDDRDETLARLVWTHPSLLGWSVETGGEGSLNRLDSNVALFVLDPNAPPVRVDLPIDQAVVKEYRGEAFVNLGRPLTANLRTDLGLTYEASRLTVSGDAEAARTLNFLKPRATFDWRPKGGWHLQLSAQRTVAQLQFEDFISAAELTSERVNGGNANLVPQRAWEFLGTGEHPLLGSGLIRLEIGYQRVSLVQDRVPTPEGFDAPGNIGSGQKYILRSKVDAPLDRFGIKGGRLTLHGSLVKTSVRDPYTFRRRRFSNAEDFYYEVTFRQDRGQFAWGLTVEGNTKATEYRLDETDTFGNQPLQEVFAEYRPTARTTLRLGVENPLDLGSYRDRIFYLPSRANPNPDSREHRGRDRHIMPYVTMKHSFG
ncbi:hypothetical protein [uncultured Sphingomonas sp.]|uniref:hypothetical protein n=1 Tax=uncultured Sphingomonas sp. TaxID=158754 RepID=UPI0025FFB137|nr:hypothetical protein [uncultured Sphingomonas sp.]